MKAGIATRGGVPVLNFYILVVRTGGFWTARSVLTGHVAESRTESGAVANLARAIDAAIEIAERLGHGVEEWFAAQQPAEPRYMAMFIAALNGHEPQHTREQAPSGRFVLDAKVLKAA